MPHYSLVKICTAIIALALSATACGFGTPVSLSPEPVAAPSNALPTLSNGTLVPSSSCRAGLIEQSFERGFMFWIGQTTQERCQDQHSFSPGTGEIWVAILDKKGQHGQWLVFVDDWQENVDPVDDPNLTPPPNLRQAIRGFGKVWRTRLSDAERTALGWATGDELPYSTSYSYRGRDYTDETGKHILLPGEHTLQGLAGDTFVFDELTQSVSHTVPK